MCQIYVFDVEGKICFLIYITFNQNKETYLGYLLSWGSFKNHVDIKTNYSNFRALSSNKFEIAAFLSQ